MFGVLAAISVSHVLNDTLTTLLPAIYPLLKSSFSLDFAAIGLITLTYHVTGSLLQPLIGLYADRKPTPYFLPVGMTLILGAMLILSIAGHFATLLVAAAILAMGSSIFHPEASRVARMASGGQHGLAQSIFQVGGYAGSALGPLLAAFIVLPRGQAGIAWFAIVALAGIVLSARVSVWVKAQYARSNVSSAMHVARRAALPAKRVALSIGILMALLFSKWVYLVSLTSYYTFYLMSTFQISVQSAQVHLFVFLGAIALGTMAGGLAGDRIGHKRVIWCSILGVLPFTLLLPHANLLWTGILSVVIGLILASAFSAIVVYAQELIPGRVGMISGLCFGFSFGVAGLGAALLGELADRTSIQLVFLVCSFLPVCGLLTAFLPDLQRSTLQPDSATAV